MAVYSHASNLFTDDTGQPMKFSMRPCKDRVKLRPMVEHGGGVLMASSIDPNTIKLLEEGGTTVDDDVFSSSYITDCCEADTILDKENYRCTKDTSAFDFDIDDTSSDIPMVRLGAHDKKGRRKYLLSEQHNIIKYLAENYRYTDCKGNMVWKDMEKLEITAHTWQSMRDHYIKIIQPNLAQFNVKPSWIRMLNPAMSNKSDEELNEMTVTNGEPNQIVARFGPPSTTKVEDQGQTGAASLMPATQTRDKKYSGSRGEVITSSTSDSDNPATAEKGKRTLYKDASNPIEKLPEAMTPPVVINRKTPSKESDCSGVKKRSGSSASASEATPKKSKQTFSSHDQRMSSAKKNGAMESPMNRRGTSTQKSPVKKKPTGRSQTKGISKEVEDLEEQPCESPVIIIAGRSLRQRRAVNRDVHDNGDQSKAGPAKKKENKTSPSLLRASGTEVRNQKGLSESPDNIDKTTRKSLLQEFTDNSVVTNITGRSLRQRRAKDTDVQPPNGPPKKSPVKRKGTGTSHERALGTKVHADSTVTEEGSSDDVFSETSRQVGPRHCDGMPNNAQTGERTSSSKRKREEDSSSSDDEISFNVPHLDTPDDEVSISTESDIRLVKKYANKFGFSVEQFFYCLKKHSGSLPDTIQWIKYGTDCNGFPGWTSDDDDLLQNDAESYENLVSKYGEEKVQRRALYINDLQDV